MGEVTKISWTDHTFNPWIGCTKVSPGCDNCYAETLNHRWGDDNWGKGKPRRMTSDSNWRQPLKWDRDAAQSGVKAKVFCASLADVMDDEAPEGGRERLWELIDRTPNLIWQLLTKRPHRYERYLPKNGVRHGNVWLGTTCENQEFYDVRWPILKYIAARYSLTSWISYEPAIGPLSIRKGVKANGYPFVNVWLDYPDWIIFGGESGQGRRPMERKWADDLLAECNQTGTRFFMKQFSALTPDKGKDLIPAELLIRQFPGESQ